MRKISSILLILLMGAVGGVLADSTTSRMGLVKPSIGSPGWGTKTNANWDVVDSSAAVLSKANAFTSTNTFSASVGIGNTSPASKLHITDGDVRITTTTGSRGIIFQDGTVLISTSGIGSGSVSGSTGQLGVFTAGSTLGGYSALTYTSASNTFAVGTSTLVVAAGRVGIGIASPSGLFHLYGSGPSVIFESSDGNALQIKRRRAGGSDSIVDAWENQNGFQNWTLTLNGSEDLYFGDPNGNTSILYMKQNGSVGIGNSSPATKLHISSGVLTLDGTSPSISVAGNTVVNTSGKVPATLIYTGTLPADVIASSVGVTTVGLLQLSATGSPTSSTFLRGDNTWATPAITVNQAADYSWTGKHTWTSSATFQNAGFSVGGSTFVVTGGRVGIGTASPGYDLEVSRDASGGTVNQRIINISSNAGSDARLNIAINGGAAGDPLLYFNIGATTDWTEGVDNSDSDKFKVAKSTFLGGANTYVTLDTSGNLGIGTQNPATKLHLSSGVATLDGSGAALTVSGTGTFSSTVTATAFTTTGTGGGTYTTPGSYIKLDVNSAVHSFWASSATDPSGAQYVTTSNTLSLTNKTFDANATGNVLAWTDKFEWHNADYILNTTNAWYTTTSTHTFYGRAQWSGTVSSGTLSAGTNVVYVEMFSGDDFDTSVVPTCYLSDQEFAADTSSRSYIVAIASVTAGVTNPASLTYTNPITVAVPNTSPGGLGYQGQSASTSMTGWNSFIAIAKHYWIAIYRDGSNTTTDPSTVASAFDKFVLNYGRRQ